MHYNETPTKGNDIMTRNEKINLALTATIVLGSTAVFATSAMRMTRATKKLSSKIDTLKVVAVNANTLTA